MTTEPTHPKRRALGHALWLSLALAGCAAGQPRVASDLAAEVPANLRADYASFTQNCSKCHSLDRPLHAQVDDVRHWDLYVAKMMRTAGSAISAQESPKILRFLYWFTQRKQRLAAEATRAKQAAVAEAIEEKAPPAPVAPAPAAPPAPPAAVPATDPVSDPNQGKQGDAAP
jgi:hypothetical protein